MTPPSSASTALPYSKDKEPTAATAVNTTDLDYDPLDMNSYSLNKLPKRPLSKAGMFFQSWGVPIALIIFVVFSYFVHFPILNDKQQVMFGLFAAALFLWISEAVPNYVTSMLLICGLVLTGIVKAKPAMATLGDPVIWLNISAFVLASAMVKTQLIKRVALWLILRFGNEASSIFMTFLAINVILAAFVNATAAKAALMMPLFMVISAVYGAPGTDKTNNFSRNLVLHNLVLINASCNAFMTGSGANLLAIALLAGAGVTIYYFDWFVAGLPLVIGFGILSYVIGARFVFPMSKDDRQPKLEGGRESLQKAYNELGKFKVTELKATIVFGLVLLLWATDKLHGMNSTVVAMLGAIIMLVPQFKLLNWNDIDIPWHLMLFSAGAYALGAGLTATKLMDTLTTEMMRMLGMETMSYFTLYCLLTGVFIASHFIFQSKNMRTIIFMPIVIGICQQLQIDILSLALPVALCINCCWTLPFNAKPNAMLYGTNKYTMGEAFAYGATMSVLYWAMLIISGGTYFHWLGITPGFF